MKAAVTILGGGDKKTIQAGDEIPDGYFSDEELESAKAAGVIEGEGPNAEEEEGEAVMGKTAPSEAKDTADLQAKERLSGPAAEAAAKKQAEADKAEAEAQKTDAEAAKKAGT